MDLDGAKLKSPLIQQRQKMLQENVNRELKMIQNKIKLASEMGYETCSYKVRPSLKYPDPQAVVPQVLEALRRRHFDVSEGDDSVLEIRWGRVA